MHAAESNVFNEPRKGGEPFETGPLSRVTVSKGTVSTRVLKEFTHACSAQEDKGVDRASNAALVSSTPLDKGPVLTGPAVATSSTDGQATEAPAPTSSTLQRQLS
jgi:hypothetical protein